MTGPLLQLLERRLGGSELAQSALADAAYRLGSPGLASMEEQMAGLALCARGESIETVSKYLSWRDFEGFCSGILRGRGFSVRENLVLRRPRAQVDILAVSSSFSLAVDCKHWSRPAGHSALARIVDAQKARAKRLRDTLDSFPPVASVVVVLLDEETRFVNGGAVVPVFTLGSFVEGVEGFREALDFA